MSKSTDDLIDRIQGAATALRGVRSKLSPPKPEPPVEPAAPDVAQEEYNHAKQVIAELKANVDSLEAEVNKESKVPGQDAPGEPKSGGTLGSPGQAAAHSATSDQKGGQGQAHESAGKKT